MYAVYLTSGAQADLARLDRRLAQRVLRKLRWLAENAELATHEALTCQWRGVFKLRIGDHRLLYTFSKAKQTVTVHFIKHRREVYESK